MTVKRLQDILQTQDYSKIGLIDGSHPLKSAAPGTYVEYNARKRKGGKVAYFNFRLAKEMGLIAKNHPEVMNPELNRVLCETFGIIIINEWDMAHQVKFEKSDIKKNTYMATRYLQLQHPNKRGVFSGDGRSLWNGLHQAPDGRVWDISSCGTGATCLSPASAINKVFYRSGDKTVSYGCGYSELSEGVIDVLFSEIFNRNGIKAERTLCVIEFPGTFGVTVRAGLNLLRPSHFFNHLRQGQRTRLTHIIDYYIDREFQNRSWPPLPQGACRYEYMLERVALSFAEVCAVFEAQYVFCWLDWDGDNVLADGGVIDFGSVRQFGLFHHMYRFDDDGRWSTNIKEQKNKAHHIIASFAQIVDFIKTGKKRNHSYYLKKAKVHKFFDEAFNAKKLELTLERVGFAKPTLALILKHERGQVKRFAHSMAVLEKAVASRGFEKVPDGKTRPAVFNIRELLRELPRQYLLNGLCDLSAQEVVKLMRSGYARPQDLKISVRRRYEIKKLQERYLGLIRFAAAYKGVSEHVILAEVNERASRINRYRVTGDALCIIGERLTRMRKQLSQGEFFALVQVFLERQVLNPDEPIYTDERHLKLSPRVRTALEEFDKTLRRMSEGL